MIAARRISGLKTRLGQWQKRLLPLCYAVALVGFLGFALLRFLADRAAETRLLDLAAARSEGLSQTAPGSYLTEGGDAQLIFEGLDANIRTVSLNAAFQNAPGELELFWVRGAVQPFSARQRAIGAPQNDGSVLYRLPPGRVADLRVDLGILSENVVVVSALTLNPRLPAAHYFVPSPRSLFFLALAPALASCAIVIIIEGVAALRAHTRRETGKSLYAE